MWRVSLMAFVKFNGCVIAEMSYIALEMYVMVSRLLFGKLLMGSDFVFNFIKIVSSTLFCL